ncbi:aquaporin-1-like [Chanos chanos]|uniref:Aquaporin-1-like n=1 Tax=Chanos chanos TaxID=29144 RepID=A0A6J2X0C8_CHACN|nr:aquaporin-1-like [Chanos chanos]
MKLLSMVTLALRDMWTLAFFREVLLEFLGTTLFLFTSLSSIVLWPRLSPLSDSMGPAPSSRSETLQLSHECRSDAIRVSLAFGTSLTLTLVCLGPLHLNPAVTMAMIAGLRVSPWRAVLHVGSQLLGAMCACALLMSVSPQRENLGRNEITSGVFPYQAFTVELLVTFQLVLCILTVSHPKSAVSSFSPALAGLSVTLGHLVAIGFTGCGMNPARSFGPAVLTVNFQNHWVFWAGPCAGAVLAWLLHDLVLLPRWSCPADWLTEFKAFFLKDSSKQSRSAEDSGE